MKVKAILAGIIRFAFRTDSGTRSKTASMSKKRLICEKNNKVGETYCIALPGEDDIVYK